VPEVYSGYPFDQFVARIGGSLLLLNEVWFISITSFSNVPYWSICFEFWYYVTFALVVFMPKRRGVIARCSSPSHSGRSSCSLPPVVAGVLLYRWRATQDWSGSVSLGLAVLSSVGIVAFHAFGISEWCSDWLMGVIGKENHRQLTFAKFFIGDYILGVLVFLNFASMRNVLAHHGQSLLLIERPVRLVANYTFTLYLLHQPLFLFWGAVVQGSGRARLLVDRHSADVHDRRGGGAPHREPALHPARFPVPPHLPHSSGAICGSCPP
jgi:peptidoglycan/LPS O-acetylase OafA/YrhL